MISRRLFCLFLLHLQHSFSTPIARGREAVPRPPYTSALGVAGERTGAVVQLGERVACNVAMSRLRNNPRVFVWLSGRAPASGARERWFKSHLRCIYFLGWGDYCYFFKAFSHIVVQQYLAWWACRAVVSGWLGVAVVGRQIRLLYDFLCPLVLWLTTSRLFIVYTGIQTRWCTKSKMRT